MKAFLELKYCFTKLLKKNYCTFNEKIAAGLTSQTMKNGFAVSPTHYFQDVSNSHFVQFLNLYHYSQLFGEADADAEVSPDTEDPELNGIHIILLILKHYFTALL